LSIWLFLFEVSDTTPDAQVASGWLEPRIGMLQAIWSFNGEGE